MVFPGQGSQHVGMLAELAASFATVQATFREASAVVGYDLWQLVQAGPADQLALTHVTQPLMLTSSVAIWRVWQQQGGRQPVLMAGHSLGEYSALVCAGALDFASTVMLVRQRGEFMQSAVPVGTGTMAAVLGLDDAVVVQCCAQASNHEEVVTAANYNSPGQIVIAGHVAAIERAVALCKEAGAKRALLLPVSAPFHSPLMAPAAAQFAAVLAKVAVQAPNIPVIQNYGLQSSSAPDEIRRNLVAQIANPVPWVATMNQFVDRKVVQLLEMGPGKVLTGLNKRINSTLETIAINDPASLNQALGHIAALG
ncbi:MAG: ACP S-malonyltransferase [Gammaproteobacteria bacterium]